MKKKFTYHDGQFFLNGEPYTVISGAIHYFRTMPEDWEDRLTKLKACGFNTVETYCCWNLHERREGEFDFSGLLDIVRFIETAEKLDLNVILRPGPYICAEWEFGGLPAWLLKEDGIRLDLNCPESSGCVGGKIRVACASGKEGNTSLLQFLHGIRLREQLRK